MLASHLRSVSFARAAPLTSIDRDQERVIVTSALACSPACASFSLCELLSPAKFNFAPTSGGRRARAHSSCARNGCQLRRHPKVPLAPSMKPLLWLSSRLHCTRTRSLSLSLLPNNGQTFTPKSYSTALVQPQLFAIVCRPSAPFGQTEQAASRPPARQPDSCAQVALLILSPIRFTCCPSATVELVAARHLWAADSCAAQDKKRLQFAPIFWSHKWTSGSLARGLAARVDHFIGQLSLDSIALRPKRSARPVQGASRDRSRPCPTSRPLVRLSS